MVEPIYIEFPESNTNLHVLGLPMLNFMSLFGLDLKLFTT